MRLYGKDVDVDVRAGDPVPEPETFFPVHPTNPENIEKYHGNIEIWNDVLVSIRPNEFLWLLLPEAVKRGDNAELVASLKADMIAGLAGSDFKKSKGRIKAEVEIKKLLCGLFGWKETDEQTLLAPPPPYFRENPGDSSSGNLPPAYSKEKEST